MKSDGCEYLSPLDTCVCLYVFAFVQVFNAKCASEDLHLQLQLNLGDFSLFSFIPCVFWSALETDAGFMICIGQRRSKLVAWFQFCASTVP